MTGKKVDSNENRPLFAVGELMAVGSNDVFIATVSEKWIVDNDTVRYPKKTGHALEKALRFHEEPQPDWFTYIWNSRRTCRKYFSPIHVSCSVWWLFIYFFLFIIRR